MNTKLMLLASLAIVATACNGGSSATTRVSGSFDAEDAPGFVQISVGDQLDTTIAVVDGKFQADIPTDVKTIAHATADDKGVAFVADGSRIVLDFEEETATSSSKKGVQSTFNAYQGWMEAFMDEFNDKMEELQDDEEAAEAYYESAVAQYNDYQKKILTANSDNILALMALSEIQEDDADEMLSLLNGLSDELKAIPAVERMITVHNNKKTTVEGAKFLDFTIEQEPGVPESRVSLSDYVGKGKYILVDFWASWCGPCRAEMPNLKNVYDTFHGDRFDMLSVAVWDEVDATRKAAEELGIVWNQIVNAQQVPTDLYGIEGIPHIILFGPDGTIVARGLRGERIGQKVAEVLAE